VKREIVINSIIRSLNAKSYLEIGVQTGKNFFKVKAPFKIAIDPEFKIKTKRKIWNIFDYTRSKFFEVTSDDFFAEKAKSELAGRQIEVAFIDGLHTYEQSFADFENCFKHLSPKGVILFHDCNPDSYEASVKAYSPQDMKEKFPQKSTFEWNGDVWKSIVRLRSQRPDLEVFTLDFDYGIGVVRRGKPHSMLNYTLQDIDMLTYEELAAKRKELLNLKGAEFLDEFVKSL